MALERYEIIDSLTDSYLNKEIPIIVEKVQIIEDTYTNKSSIQITVKNIGKEEIELLGIKLHSSNNDVEDIRLEMHNLRLNDEITNEYLLNYTKINLEKVQLFVETIKFVNQEKNSKEYLLQELQNKSIVYETVNDNMWKCSCSNIYYKDVTRCPKCNISKEEARNNRELKEQEREEQIENMVGKIKKYIIPTTLIVTISIICITFFMNLSSNVKDKNETTKAERENKVLSVKYENESSKTNKEIETSRGEEVKEDSRAEYKNKAAKLIQTCYELKNVLYVNQEDYNLACIKNDGTVVQFGSGSNGWTPDVSSLKNVISVNYTGNDFFAVLSDGTVYTDEFGSSNDLSSKRTVSSWKNIKRIVSDGARTIGIHNNGTVEVEIWDTVENKEKMKKDLATWKNIIDVQTVGASNIGCIIGLKADGTVVYTGTAEYGFNEKNINSWKDIKMISMSSDYIVGLKSDGTVVVCNNEKRKDIEQLEVNSWKNIVMISLGSGHLIGLKSNGTVVATGSNYYGQCDVSNKKNIIAVYGGSATSILLKDDGRIEVIGRMNTYTGVEKVKSWNNLKKK